MKVVLAPKSAPKSWATPLRTETPEQGSPVSPRARGAGLEFLMIMICLWIKLNSICATFWRAGLVKNHYGVPEEQKNERSSCNLLHTTISFIHRVQKGVYLINFLPSIYLFVAPYRQRKFQILRKNLWSRVIDQHCDNWYHVNYFGTLFIFRI